MGKAISSEACRTCSKCQETKPNSEFYFRQSKGRYESRCKDCVAKQNRDYYERNREHIIRTSDEYRRNNAEKHREWSKAYHRRRMQEAKQKVFAHFGEQCACCGEADIAFLTIDHVNNDGHLHRNEIKSQRFYEWLVRNDFQSDYDLQTLCFNCNFAKRYNGGVCPHQERSETIREE